MLRLEKRPEASQTMSYVSPLIAVALMLIGGLILFAALGKNPIEGFRVFFISPISDLYGLSELLLKATPLMLCAIGLAIGFRANVWNIGAEGQLTVGAIAGGGMALALWGVEGFWVLPLVCLAGALGGMAYAAIPAFLKTRFEVNEILTSLMLTYVATLALSALVFGPWKDPMGFNFPQSKMFTDSALLPTILAGTRLHLGVAISLLIALLVWLAMSFSLVGFQVRVAGQAPAAARYAGFSGKRIVWGSLLTSGAFAGLAGTFEITGPIGQLIPSITPGYGFTAIIVAFLGRLNPLGIVFAGLVMALSYIGGENAQVEVGMPQAVTGVFQGMLLFFLLASDFLVRYRLAPARRREARP